MLLMLWQENKLICCGCRNCQLDESLTASGVVVPGEKVRTLGHFWHMQGNDISDTMFIGDLTPCTEASKALTWTEWVSFCFGPQGLAQNPYVVSLFALPEIDLQKLTYGSVHALTWTEWVYACWASKVGLIPICYEPFCFA